MVGALWYNTKKLVWLTFQHHYRSFVITWLPNPQSIIFFKLLGWSRPLFGLKTLLNLLCVLKLVQKKKFAKIPKRDFQSSKPNCGSLQEVHLCCTCREAARHPFDSASVTSYSLHGKWWGFDAESTSECRLLTLWELCAACKQDISRPPEISGRGRQENVSR